MTSGALAIPNPASFRAIQTTVADRGVSGAIRVSPGKVPFSRFAALLSSPDASNNAHNTEGELANVEPANILSSAHFTLTTALIQSAHSIVPKGLPSQGSNGGKLLLTVVDSQPGITLNSANTSRTGPTKQRRAERNSLIQAAIAVPVQSLTNDRLLKLVADISGFPAMHSSCAQPIDKQRVPMNTQSSNAAIPGSSTKTQDKQLEDTKANVPIGRMLAVPAVIRSIAEATDSPESLSTNSIREEPNHLSFQLILPNPAAVRADSINKAMNAPPHVEPVQSDTTGSGKGFGAHSNVETSVAASSPLPIPPSCLNVPAASRSTDPQEWTPLKDIAPVGVQSTPAGKQSIDQSKSLPLQSAIADATAPSVEGELAVVATASAGQGNWTGDQHNSRQAVPSQALVERDPSKAQLDNNPLTNSDRPVGLTTLLGNTSLQASNASTQTSGQSLLPKPAAGRTPAMPNLTQLPQATGASQIAIRLDSNGVAGQVELRIRERAGEVHIDVRSADAGVAKALRQDLGELIKRLDPHGSTSDSFRQDSHLPELETHFQHMRSSDSARGYSLLSDDAQQRQHQQQQQARQQAVQQDDSDDALEELRTVFNDLNNGASS